MTFNNYDELIEFLFQYQDNKYLEFNKKIINTKSEMIGIRIPILIKIAKEFKNSYIPFFTILKNKYYEENILEGLVIAQIKDKKLFDDYFKKFIKKIDNWASCDICLSHMKQLGKDEKYFSKSIDMIKENKVFISRCGYIILLNYYLKDKYIDEVLNIVDNNLSDYYYTNMAKAWLISICFIKYRDKTLKYLSCSNLDTFTYNKAIQKIIESNRVSIIDKEYLKTLKRRTN